MDTNFNNMTEWEKDKAHFLIKCALDLGMKIDGYGMISVNQNSGYTYLWLEDYSFTLYLPISCELTKGDVWVLWSNPEDGEEKEITLDNHDLDYLERFCDVMYRRYCA